MNFTHGACIGKVPYVVARNADQLIDLCDTPRDDLNLVHNVDLFSE